MSTNCSLAAASPDLVRPCSFVAHGPRLSFKQDASAFVKHGVLCLDDCSGKTSMRSCKGRKIEVAANERFVDIRMSTNCSLAAAFLVVRPCSFVARGPRLSFKQDASAFVKHGV